MQKSLFTKYLRITSLIILVSFLCLGLVMIFVISQYWQTEKRDLLSRNARSVAELAESTAFFDGTQYNLDGNRLQAFMTVFAESSDSEIFLTDRGGNRLVSSSVDSESPAQDAVVASAYMQPALSGGYIGLGTLGGIYQEAHYVVGVPISVEGLAGRDIVIGAVFAASNARLMDGYRRNIVKMFLFAALVTFLVSFAVVWVFSYRMARPLREMAHAAREFGSGNFSVRVNASTDDEIGQLALAFNNMASSLATSENVRRNFIANVSHELKTPMTTIAGFIDGILDGTIPQEKQSHYLKIVSQEVKRLSRLVRTMLDLSRIDNGELKLRPGRFDISHTVVEALLSFEKSIDDKQLEIQGLEDMDSLFVDGDPDMIHQVVYNLTENAVKFTNPGGYIRFRVEDLPDRVQVTIRNSGQGIPADEVPLVFDRFYKTDKSRSQDKTGMGLGLYIVKTIIKLHNGEITVSSVENEYCQFQFWLPKITVVESAKALKDEPAAPKNEK